MTLKHIFYYLFLFVVLFLSALAIYLTPNDGKMHMGITVFAASFYVFWAVMHHMMHHDLTGKVVIEYVLIAMVGISLVYFVLETAT